VILAKKAIKLRYHSAARFCSDYALIRKGKIFLPSKSPLPEGSKLALEFNLPGIDLAFMVKGLVTRTIDKQTATRFKKPPGMLVDIIDGPEGILKKLEPILSANEEYRRILNLPHPISTPQEPAADKTEIDKLAPADKIAEEDSTTSITPDEDFVKQSVSSEAEAIGQKISQEPDVMTEVKACDEKEMPEDPRPAPEAQKPLKSSFGDDYTERNKRKKVDEFAEKSIPSKDMGTNDFEASEDKSDIELSLEWIRKAVNQKEVDKEEEEAPEAIPPPVNEKKNLTTEERNRVKPAGEFIMNLTKAMLRSGYYAPDHTGSKNAKRGLYEALQKSLGATDEIMITHQETGRKTDILIVGILDEPVNVRTLVGEGMAELFVPKLREYFKRKGLISFAIKKNIPLNNFEKFVDIMGDPKSDQGENVKVGELLSNTLAEHGISEISTVFMDDMIAIEQNLPWRVEMAIQRMAKDLKVLPMFEGKSEQAMVKLKLQIIQDIIRPLTHPEFLKDLVINCYVIAKNSKNMDTEEIEQAIIDSIPLQALLPTSKFIFKELNQLTEAWKEHPFSEVLKRRITSVKRILKWVSRRLVLADAQGAQSFLEQLYLNEILAFEELPPDVQYLVNTMKMADDLRAHVNGHARRILGIKAADDAVVMLKFFKRAAPLLIENQNWPILLVMTQALDKAAKGPIFTSEVTGLRSNPLNFVFNDLKDELLAAYLNAEESQRQTIDDIVEWLGPLGVEILSKVLSESDDRRAHKSATDALIKKGNLARQWVLHVLDDPDQVWHLQRNALRILSCIGYGGDDIDRARKLLHHEHPRVRDEALNAVISLKASDAEQLIIDALNDEDDKVRWRATTSLSDLATLSETSLMKLLDILTAEPPEEKEAAAKHAHKVAQLIRSIGARDDLPNLQQIEDTILEIAQGIYKQEKGLLKRLKKSADSDQAGILTAAISTLGRIGGSKSETFLGKLANSKSPQTETAQEAIDSIRARSGK
jgi:hypothetical protein